MAGTRSFTPDLFEFLKQLKAHNDRDWFEAHRAAYEQHCKAPAVAFVQAMAPRLEQIRTELRHPDHSRCPIFERDKVQDLKVGLKEINGKNVTLILVMPLKQDVTGNVTKSVSGGVSILGILIAVFIVILGLIIYLLLRKKS